MNSSKKAAPVIRRRRNSFERGTNKSSSYHRVVITIFNQLIYSCSSCALTVKNLSSTMFAKENTYLLHGRWLMSCDYQTWFCIAKVIFFYDCFVPSLNYRLTFVRVPSRYMGNRRRNKFLDERAYKAEFLPKVARNDQSFRNTNTSLRNIV